MKKIRHYFKQIIISPPAVAAITSAIIMIFVLMVHPLIGMADNGDFFRTINGQGIYKLDRYENDQYFNYFSSKYGMYQYYNDWEDSIMSSQNLYIQASIFLNGLLGADSTIFDIRFLSVFLIIELVVGIYLMVDYITWKKSRLQGMLLGAVCVVMFADTAYTAYFNSFYAEGIVYVSCLIMIASALLLTQKRYPPFPLFFSIIINGMIMIYSKQQNATEGLPLFLLCIFIAFFFPIKRKSFQSIAIGGAVLMAVSGIMMYVIIPEDFVRINQYHAMTRGVMMTGENPEETMDKFGIDKQYSILDGSIYFEKYPPIEVEGQQLIDNFYSKYNFVSLATYYLTHPSELVTMLDKAARNGYMIRPAVQGNYERSAGKEPGAKTYFFTLYSSLKEKYVPNTVGFVAIWMLAVCVMSFRDKPKLLIMICVIIMGLIQIGTSIVGAGDADLAKHIFMYNVSFDIISFICFAPMLTTFMIYLMKGVLKFVRRKKIAVIMALLFFVGFHCFTLTAEASDSSKSTAVIISHQGEDVSVTQKLAEASGLDVTVLTEQNYEKNSLEGADYVITTTTVPMEDINRTKKQALCLGAAFMDIPDSTVTKYQNKRIQFSYNEYVGDGIFLEEFSAITSTSGRKFGNIMIEGGREVPFAVLASDGNYYIPCFDKENSGSIVLLGAALDKMTGHTEERKTYFIMDEVYAFSDLNKLCGWADLLYNNGIPFLVRIMPIYDNLNYPAFSRFTQVLRYMQSKGGTIIIHEPLVEEQQTEREPLADKMARFEQGLDKESIYYREISNIPYLFSIEKLLEINSENKNFGNLPFDIMIGVTPVLTDEEFSMYVEKINRKWMTFTDLQKEYEDSTYIYYDKDNAKDYIYRPKGEAAFKIFFDTSDRFLIIVVGISLLVLGVFLMIGRRWYRRKFYR